MGAIAKLLNGSVPGKAFPGEGRGREAWRQIFGSSTKEDFHKFPKVLDRPGGGSWAASTLSTNASFIRLLQAMRSMAPGGWSDDRWEETKHFVGITYVAIHRVCTQLQQAEFQVFHKDLNHPDGKRIVTPMDPPEGDRHCRPYDLVRLLEKPNRLDSFGKTMYRWGQQKRLTGTALTWMVPNKLGVPMEIYSIPTAIAIPQPAVNPDYPDGYYRIQPVYPYGPFSSYPTPASAVGAPIPAQWMLKFQYPHPLLRYDGYSPLTGMRLHIDEVESIDRSRWYKMKKSVRPSAVLSMKDMEGAQPMDEAQIERMVAQFEAAHQSPENHGSLITCPPGGSLDEWGQTPTEMDYGNSWDQLTSFVLGGGFGITKPAAGMVEESAYSNLFATLKQLDLVTLSPECDDTASELTRHLGHFFGDDLIVEIRVKRIDDHEIKFTKVDKLMAGKAITKNELRKEMDMPLTKEPWGNEIAGEGGQEQQPGMPGQQPGMPGQEGPPQAEKKPEKKPEGKPMEEAGPEQREEPEEVTRSRPRPGKLGEGALGPRKALILNGNGHMKVLPKSRIRRF